eukprot:1226821-Pleurochrysis_carterae.AAC.2
MLLTDPSKLSAATSPPVTPSHSPPVTPSHSPQCPPSSPHIPARTRITYPHRALAPPICVRSGDVRSCRPSHCARLSEGGRSNASAHRRHAHAHAPHSLAGLDSEHLQR